MTETPDIAPEDPAVPDDPEWTRLRTLGRPIRQEFVLLGPLGCHRFLYVPAHIVALPSAMA